MRVYGFRFKGPCSSTMQADHDYCQYDDDGALNPKFQSLNFVILNPENPEHQAAILHLRPEVVPQSAVSEEGQGSTGLSRGPLLVQQ